MTIGVAGLDVAAFSVDGSTFTQLAILLTSVFWPFDGSVRGKTDFVADDYRIESSRGRKTLPSSIRFRLAVKLRVQSFRGS